MNKVFTDRKKMGEIRVIDKKFFFTEAKLVFP